MLTPSFIAMGYKDDRICSCKPIINREAAVGCCHCGFCSPEKCKSEA